MNSKLIGRFEAFAMPEPNSGCWLWTGSVNHSGYGYFKMPEKIWRAHRAAYVLYRGGIPANMVVMHKCDNPSCCNPDHLKLGTQADNLADMRSKGRQKLQRYETRVHMRPSRLSSKQVADIRRRYLSDASLTFTALAAEYGFSRPHMRDLIKGKVKTFAKHGGP